MKILIMGNSGSGKTTLAKALMERQSQALPGRSMSLDEVAFSEGVQRRPVSESLELIRGFVEDNPAWIIEGCYSSLLEPLLPLCQVLVFLNPGVDRSVANCHSRPWEEDKFTSSESQDAQLEFLISWVRQYPTRDDEYGLHEHRRLFDSYTGRKLEFTTLRAHMAEETVAAIED